MRTVLALAIAAIIAVGVLSFTKLISRFKSFVMVGKAKEVKADVRTDLSVQAVKVPGPQSDAKQLVVRRLNWKDKNELTERQAAENLCKFTERQSWTLETREQNDPVDVTARSPDGKYHEDFQIVRLWAKDEWQELNTKGTVDRCYTDHEAVELFRKVFGNKGFKKYPTNVRKELTLIIDGNPVASVSAFLAGIESAVVALVSQLGYRSVWVVSTDEAHKLV